MRPGPRPYGRAPGDEELAVATMRRLHASGESLRSICAVLGRMRLAPPRGADWHPSTVRRILRQHAGRSS